MKIYIFILLGWLIIPYTTYSQGITNYGAILISDPNTFINIIGNGNLILEDFNATPSTLTNNGTILISGKLLNNTTSINSASLGTGVFEFNGNTDQEIGGSNSLVLQKINLDNTVYLSNDLTLSSNLNFTDGVFEVKNFDLTMADGSTITGSSNTNFVNTENSGNLVMYAISGGSSILFPVGTSTSYTPVTIGLNSGASQYFSVSLLDGVWSNGITGDNLALTEPVVDRTWIIYSDVTHDVDLSLQWNLSDEKNGFVRTSAFTNVYDNSWSTGNAVVTGTDPFEVTFSGVTELTSSSVHAMTDDQTTLDIDLLEFIGIANKNSNLIEWTTSSEKNTEYFVLYKCTDNQNYNKVYLQDAAGNSNIAINYKFEDLYNIEGIIYYKLEVHDFDGEIHNFNPISVSRTTEKISLWQHEKKIIINLSDYKEENLSLFIYDANGRILIQENIEKTSGNSTVIFDVSNLPTGIYAVKIQGDKDIFITKKVFIP